MKTKTQNHFLSYTIYQEMIPLKNAYRKLQEFIDWIELAARLGDMYTNDQGGAPNYAPSVMLKALFMQKVWSASDREVENLSRNQLEVKYPKTHQGSVCWRR